MRNVIPIDKINNAPDGFWRIFLARGCQIQSGHNAPRPWERFFETITNIDFGLVFAAHDGPPLTSSYKRSPIRQWIHLQNHEQKFIEANGQSQANYARVKALAQGRIKNKQPIS